MGLGFQLHGTGEGFICGGLPASFEWRGRYQDAYDIMLEALIGLDPYELDNDLVVVIEHPFNASFVARKKIHRSVRNTAEAMAGGLIREMKIAVLRGQLRPPVHFRKRATQ